MDLRPWSKIKSSGNFRRKVRNAYLDLKKIHGQDKVKESKDGSVEKNSNCEKLCSCKYTSCTCVYIKTNVNWIAKTC